MAIQLNHTILYARDSKASAKFLAEILGLPAPVHWGPFEMVTTANGTNLDYLDTGDEIASQHYAFLVSEPEFDEIFGRIKAAEAQLLGRPRPIAARRDQPSRWRARPLLRGPRTGISSRSSRAPTAAADGIRERYNALTIPSVIFLASPSSIMVLSR